MSRKPVVDGGMKDKIAKAAMDLFMENGFDGTSVRSIMNAAGGEIGLFYYYFKNKDDVFDAVLDLFFAQYITGFEAIVAHGKRNPCRIMQDFFEYMEKETTDFRRKYADNLHRTVRWAIREHTLTIIEPFIRQVVDIQSSYYGIQPALASGVATLFLTHGVGSAILHEDSEEYMKERGEIKKGISILMGMAQDSQEMRIPYPAEKDDLIGILALLEKEGINFSVADKKKYETQLAKSIKQGEIWVFREQEEILAVILYSKKKQEIQMLVVAQDFRRKGLASKLIETAAAQFPEETEIFALLNNENSSKNVSALKFLEAIGFAENEKLEKSKASEKRMSLLIPIGKPVTIKSIL